MFGLQAAAIAQFDETKDGAATAVGLTACPKKTVCKVCYFDASRIATEQHGQNRIFVCTRRTRRIHVGHRCPPIRTRARCQCNNPRSQHAPFGEVRACNDNELVLSAINDNTLKLRIVTLVDAHCPLS